MVTLKTLEDLRVDFIAGTLAVGGAERQLYYMAKVLSGAGARIRVLSLTSGETYEKDIDKLGVPIIYVGRFPSRIIRLYNIICELKKDPPEIIHSVHFYTNLYAAIAARMVGAKEIGTIRSNLFYEVKGLSFFGKLSLIFPRFLIANSRKAIENASSFGVRAESICLLENIVDTELFQPVYTKTKFSGISESTVRIIYVGRFEKYKRIDIFLQVLSEVYRLNPHTHGMIVGDGPLRKSLEDLSMELHLGPDVVKFTGIVDDMPSAYQQADILVLTSEFEGMPNVVLEAMACGLPVVATDVGAVPDIVSHGITGDIVPVGDTNGLIKYVLGLVQSATLRQDMGSRARTLAEERFSLKTLQQKLFLLYASVLASR